MIAWCQIIIKPGTCRAKNGQSDSWRMESFGTYSWFSKAICEVTSLSCGEKYDTLTYVIPCYYHLETHLKDVMAQQQVSPVRGVANTLLAELRKFAFLVDPAQGEKNFPYATATLLHPMSNCWLGQEMKLSDVSRMWVMRSAKCWSESQSVIDWRATSEAFKIGIYGGSYPYE